LSQVLLQLELVTGLSVKIGSHARTLIWVLLQTLVNHGTLCSKTKFTAKNKSEVFIAGIKLTNYSKNTLALKLLLTPAVTIYIHNKLYLQTQHYSSLQTVLRMGPASKRAPQITDLSFLHSRLNMRLYINWRLFDKIIERAELYFKISLADTAGLEVLLKKLKISW